MKMVRITDFQEIGRIYQDHLKKDFARNERRPLAMIEKQWAQGVYDGYVMYDDEELAAYAFLMKLPGQSGYHYMLDYFAVTSGLRGQGLGTRFLKELSQTLRDAASIIVEVEDPAAAQTEEDRKIRERRVQFYLRNGYVQTGVTVLLFGVAYRLLAVFQGDELPDQAIREIYTAMYKSIIPADMFDAFFELT